MEYSIRPELSEATFPVFKCDFASVIAYNRVERATRCFDAISGDADNSTAAAIRVTVPAAGSVTDEPEMEQKLASIEQPEVLRKHHRGSRWLGTPGGGTRSARRLLLAQVRDLHFPYPPSHPPIAWHQTIWLRR